MSGGTEQQQNCRCGRLSDEAKRYITEARDTQIWLYLEIGIICCCIAFYLLHCHSYFTLTNRSLLDISLIALHANMANIWFSYFSFLDKERKAIHIDF